jgi:hypothetical protein
MNARNIFIVGALTAAVGLAVAGLSAQASKVAFPSDYGKGVLYWTQDCPMQNQVREYYTSPAAIDAARKGRRWTSCSRST